MTIDDPLDLGATGGQGWYSKDKWDGSQNYHELFILSHYITLI